VLLLLTSLLVWVVGVFLYELSTAWCFMILFGDKDDFVFACFEKKKRLL